MRGKSLVMADLKALVAVDRIDAEEGLAVTLDDADTEVGRRRSAHHPMDVEHSGRAMQTAKRGETALEAVEKLGDVGAMEELRPVGIGKNLIERGAGGADPDEAPAGHLPALPIRELKEIGWLLDRDTIGPIERCRDREAIVGAEGKIDLEPRRADRERSARVSGHHRHTGPNQCFQRGGSTGEGPDGRPAPGLLEALAGGRIEAHPVAEDPPDCGNRSPRRRGDKVRRNRSAVDAEAWREGDRCLVGKRDSDGHGEPPRPHQTPQGLEPACSGKHRKRLEGHGRP